MRLFLSLLLLLSLSASNAQFNCSSHDVFTNQMESNPAFRNNQAQLEEETRGYLADIALRRKAQSAAYTIPVVFHIIHTGGSGNITDEQITDQVAILNEEFTRQQPDTILTPAAFKPAASSFNVKFRLATIDPSGNCTNGINRVYSELSNCSMNENAIKALSYWPSNRYLNIWLVQSMHYSGNTGCSGGGYATFPGGAATLDGVNIRGDLIGSIGTAATNSGWGNFKGRYLIHELGHWFNLRHIWGDATCGNDLVADTPPAVTSNNGCPSFPQNPFGCAGSTASGEMFTNYMDYTNGPCLNMFTAGQVMRMTAAINSMVSGRNNLWSAANLIATGTADPYVYPAACAAVPDVGPYGPIVICAGDSIAFTDLSYSGSSASRSWSFAGGIPSSVSDSIVTVKYNTPGTFSLALTKNAAAGAKTTIFKNKVHVLNNPANSLYAVPFSEDVENAQDFNSNWTIVSAPEDTKSWTVTQSTNYTGISCAGLLNFGKEAPLTSDLISPLYDLTNVKSASLSFMLHFSVRKPTNEDKLEVFVSGNCGKTWKSVYVNSGTGLSTTTATFATQHIPDANSGEWVSQKINLNPTLAKGRVRFKFSFTSGGGNNLFIDDINLDGVNTTGIPASDAPGLMSLFPNPANEQATLRVELEGKSAVSVEMVDLLGKTCLSSSHLLHTGSNHIPLNSSSLADGVYITRVKQNGTVIYSTKFIKQSGN